MLPHRDDVQGHEIYMRRCFHLAEMGGSAVRPNPNVGCVIVAENRIIGEGYHRSHGGPHAEVEAIEHIPTAHRALLKRSTLYVSLEPCNHFGKTPPCTQLILGHKIPRVVVSACDPNPLMRGKSIKQLRENGLTVVQGILEEEGEFSSRHFRINRNCHRPYIILKYARSADGFIGQEGKRIWLTNPSSGVLNHTWRSEVDGILVGSQTVTVDDPELTTRYVTGPSPQRITIDRLGTLNPDLKLLADHYSTWIYTQKTPAALSGISKKRIYIEDVYNLDKMMRDLYMRGIHVLLIEGGRKILQSFIDTDLWDEARILSSPVFLEKGIKEPVLVGRKVKSYLLKDDKILIINNLKLAERLHGDSR